MKTHEFIYGIHAVRTVLESRPQDVLQLYIQDNRADKKINEIKKLADAIGVQCHFVSAKQLEKMIGVDARHQGVVANCRQMRQLNEKDLIDHVKNTEKPVVLLILDGVQDPHNLGACLRSANAFGVMAVIAPKDRAASITDVVRKVASGAAEQTPFIAVTNLHRTIKQLQENGVWFVGLDSEGTLPLSQVDMKGHIGIVMGSEGEGMRRLTQEACDYLAHIPMCGTVESLNVSVATGIALYEMRRQRK